MGYGEAELLGGMSFLDITHPEDRASNEAGFRAAVAERQPYQVEKRLLRKDGGVRWAIVSVALLPPVPGRPARAIAAVQDITERRQAEERQALLAREVNHRAKNALAVVQAALRLTRKDDPDSYARAIEGRVAALARAHTILAAGKWESVALRELVEAELATFQPSATDEALAVAPEKRVTVEGPNLALLPDAVQALSLALHELATNATKYGALSAPDGRVRVTWRVDSKTSNLTLIWRERGGPRVTGAPESRGFGSRVIETTVKIQLGGAVERTWDEEGLVCVLTVPVARALAAGATAAV
jgi:PAS domain S-box-containing protein